MAARERRNIEQIGAWHRSRPRAVTGVNAIGRLVWRLGLPYPSFDAESLVASAVKEAGRADLGSDEYVAPLATLLDALEHEATLNFVGRFVARSQIVTLLANRIRMEDWWSRHPEIGDVQISAPWFVVGLPRSGTTLMQQLLACDGANRSLLFWEATSPAPPPERATYETDPRIKSARRAQRLLDYLAPDANAIHPVGAQLPTECVSLLAHSFASLEFGVINHVPSHVRWCLEHDLSTHYAYFRRQLQLLEWHCGAERWTLKSPAHLIALDALFETFPQACVIWMHRDPITAITSHCSLVSVLQAIGSDTVDLAAIGREWPRTWAAALDRALAVRDRVGEDRFVDVDYRRWVADPVATMESVYTACGSSLDPTTAAAMRTFLAEHPQHRRGVHGYEPSQFGIDPYSLRGRLAAYRDRFLGDQSTG